jgi:hypothetical protein
VYIDSQFVEPADVNGVLANALAEIHFSLKHYRIEHAGQKGYDSFTAIVEQVVVLKAGTPKSRSAYKRENPRTGPLVVKRMRLTVNDDVSHSTPTKHGTSTTKVSQTSATNTNKLPLNIVDKDMSYQNLCINLAILISLFTRHKLGRK